MIYVTGDTHGEYGRILEFDKKLEKDDAIIVCGDFGFIFQNDDKEKQILDEIEKRNYTIMFVDGNHENFNAINTYPIEEWYGGRIHRIRRNIIHMCRGQVFQIDGSKIFTFGGAFSIDKAMRRENVSWWKQEMPTDAEFIEANKNLDIHNREVDYIITHAAPEETMNMFHPNHYEEKPLNNFLEYVRESVRYKHWYTGKHLYITFYNDFNQSSNFLLFSHSPATLVCIIGDAFSIAFLLISVSALAYISVVVIEECPRRSRIYTRLTPDCSKCIALE